MCGGTGRPLSLGGSRPGQGREGAPAHWGWVGTTSHAPVKICCYFDFCVKFLNNNHSNLIRKCYGALPASVDVAKGRESGHEDKMLKCFRVGELSVPRWGGGGAQLASPL